MLLSQYQSNLSQPNSEIDNSHPSLRALHEAWFLQGQIHLDMEFLKLGYDVRKPDFPLDLLPFSQHPTILALPSPILHKLLAAAWMGYVDKAIYVERNVIIPACHSIVKGAFNLPAKTFPAIAQTIQQASIDEEYHIYLTLFPRNISANVHQLEGLKFPKPIIHEILKDAIVKEPYFKKIIKLAFASVAETSTNAFLTLLSEDISIQPMHLMSTRSHLLDELRHSQVFYDVIPKIYQTFTVAEKTVWPAYLKLAYEAFTTPDPMMFKTILQAINLENVDDIMNFVAEQPKNPKLARNNTVLEQMLKKFDMTLSDVGAPSNQRP